MKRHNVRNLLDQNTKSTATYMVIQRLDESLPLQTEEWQKVEQMLMRISEFAPNAMLSELVNAVAVWADDQAAGDIYSVKKICCKKSKSNTARSRKS